LNPLIYPSWWGEDSDFEKEVKRERSNDAVRGKGKLEKVELKKENARRQEDTLERKLREA